MARMFPESITPEQRVAHPRSQAEFKVYDALASSLISEDWHVFYSGVWTWVEDATKRLRTREADFIIAHPDCGILLLEVKGGGIEVTNGRWISTDRDGEAWIIRDPYDQVASAASALERRLSEETPDPFQGYRFSTAVCFPDVDISRSASNLGSKHRQVTIDATRMRNLRDAIIECMRDSNGNFAPPGMPRILMLKELVAPSWFIHAPKSIQIYQTEDEIKRLTEDQFDLLYQLEAYPKVLVSGCAGSGKTMIAAHFARQMVLRERKRVLFTCYNKNLAIWIRASSFFVDNGLMMVANYQKLCADLARYAGRVLPQPKDDSREEADRVYKEVWPEIFLEVVDTKGELFDAIVVDEGQDFLESWWDPLLLLLRDGGLFHVYYDPQQRLWGRPRHLPSEISEGAAMFILHQNVRNSRPIHDLAMRFHPSHGRGYRALSTGGLEPEFVPIPPDEKEHLVLRRVVEELIEKEKVSPRDIAILTPLSIVQGNSQWKPEHTLLGRYRLVHHLNPAEHEIFCSSVGAAKGLEFPVTILTELHAPEIADEIEQLMAHLYVGVSRARSHLIVLSDREGLEHLS